MGESRAEHMQWCKKRALEYVDHDPGNAFASFGSDIRKHPETADLEPLLMVGIMYAADPAGMRKFIEGFAE